MLAGKKVWINVNKSLEQHSVLHSQNSLLHIGGELCLQIACVYWTIIFFFITRAKLNILLQYHVQHAYDSS